MYEALKRRISLSLEEIKTKNTTKALNICGETRSRGSWHKLSRWKCKCTRSKALALFYTEAAQAVGLWAVFGFFFFFFPAQRWGCRDLPQAALPLQVPFQYNPVTYCPCMSTTISLELYPWSCPLYLQRLQSQSILPRPLPPSTWATYTAILPTKLASPEPGRAELCPLNNNFKLANVTNLLLQSSKQKADKMVLWVGVYDAKPDDLNFMPGNHMMKRANSHKSSDVAQPITRINNYEHF